MAQQDLIPFRRIVEMVREFCTQRRTGTVFIVSDDNRMAQVHLESGNIVALLCRGRHGQEAVAGMRTMQAARLRFDDSYLTASDGERFDTKVLRAMLLTKCLGCAAHKYTVNIRARCGWYCKNTTPQPIGALRAVAPC